MCKIDGFRTRQLGSAPRILMSAYRFESLWETRADLQYSMCSSGSVLSLFTLASQHSALTPQCHTVSQEREEGKKNSTEFRVQSFNEQL